MRLACCWLLIPVLGCSATVEKRFDPGDPDVPGQTDPPQIDPPPPGTPPDTPPVDEPTPDPQNDDIRLELEGTHWTSKLEGSLGTYVTWFSFEAGDVMPVTEELRQWDDQSEVKWMAPGSWSVLDNGDVFRDWTHEYFGTEPTELAATWTYLPLTGPLRDKLFEGWWQEVGDEVWTRQGLIARSGTTYRAYYEHIIDHANGSSELRMSSATVTLDAAPAVGAACSMQVSLSYQETYGTTNRSGTYQDTWPCSVRADTDSTLLVVEADGFSGDDAAVRNQFSEYLYGLGHPWEDINAYTDMLSPRLYTDPADTRVLAFTGWSDQLLEREQVAPPVP